MTMTAVPEASRRTRWGMTPVLALSLLGAGAVGLSVRSLPTAWCRSIPFWSPSPGVPRGWCAPPFAVSVQGRRNLQLGNTDFSLEEALQGLPGVQIQNRYNYPVGERISIRGFGARAQGGR